MISIYPILYNTLYKVKFKTSINQSYWQTMTIGYNNSTGTFALSPSHRGAFLLIVHMGSKSTDFHAIGKKNAGNAQQKMPATCVYILENPGLLQFFVADSVPGCMMGSKGYKHS
jgi:hypothetical protein